MTSQYIICITLLNQEMIQSNEQLKLYLQMSANKLAQVTILQLNIWEILNIQIIQQMINLKELTFQETDLELIQYNRMIQRQERQNISKLKLYSCSNINSIEQLFNFINIHELIINSEKSTTNWQLTFIQYITNLKTIHLMNLSNPLDLNIISQCKTIQELHLNKLDVQYLGFSNCLQKNVIFLKYLKFNNCVNVKQCSQWIHHFNIENLTIEQEIQLKNLNFKINFKTLKSILLKNCPNLKNIHNLKYCSQLEDVCINSCGINDISSLVDLKNLKTLNISKSFYIQQQFNMNVQNNQDKVQTNLAEYKKLFVYKKFKQNYFTINQQFNELKNQISSLQDQLKPQIIKQKQMLIEILTLIIKYQ